MKKVLITLAIGVAMLSATNAIAIEVEFTHFNGQDESRAISVKPGEEIKISIKDTYPDAFSYEVGGVLLKTPAAPARAGLTIDQKTDLTTHTISQPHDPKYGGYIVKVLLKDKAAGPVKVAIGGGKTKDLSETTFMIVVEQRVWDVDFAGAFTISDVTDPVYATVPRTNEDGEVENVLIRDSGAEDSQSLGLAGMIHLYHVDRPQWAWSFGLAVSDTSETSYMTGPSYRFSDRAAVTLGYQWAPVDRLPAGTNEGDLIDDPNVLSSLDTRVDGGVFLSFSYSFIPGVRGFFEKPFKGAFGSTDASSASLPTATNGADDNGDGNDATDPPPPPAGN
ncbi:MAG: hypothetical protein AAGM16_14180 [Pseudomonadota bacterium]